MALSDQSPSPPERSKKFSPGLSGDAVSLPDGRLLYSQLLGANPAGSYGGELREVRVDSRTNKVAGDSVSFGRWPQPVVGLSVSADGRRLAFRTVLTQHSVYEGDLEENGKSLLRVRRLTFGQGRDDFPRTWTPDSKAIFFDSNRNGKWEIFKQSADQVSDEPYLQGANDEFSPRMSPDGRSLLYLDRPRDWREPEPVRLMRVSTVEAFPQFVLQTSGYSEWGLRFECAQRPGAVCILAQRLAAKLCSGPFILKMDLMRTSLKFSVSRSIPVCRSPGLWRRRFAVSMDCFRCAGCYDPCRFPAAQYAAQP
jgi:hypothetical protein